MIFAFWGPASILASKHIKTIYHLCFYYSVTRSIAFHYHCTSKKCFTSIAYEHSVLTLFGTSIKLMHSCTQTSKLLALKPMQCLFSRRLSCQQVGSCQDKNKPYSICIGMSSRRFPVELALMFPDLSAFCWKIDW